MANTYHQIYLQTVFAVKYRKAVIDKTWKEKLFAVIGNLINETNCKTIIVNGVEDHVHCFIGLKPVVAVSELMKTVKAKSSKYINDHSLTHSRFEWSRLWREIWCIFIQPIAGG
jgi:REP element-mobilizing transposase RayT